MNYQNIKKIFAYTLFGILAAACNRGLGDAHADEHDHEEHEEHEGHGHEEEEGRDHEENEKNEGHEVHGHEGHEHGEDEGSDLDRPVAELFEDSCEHGIKTHECEECRYEVGVVKAREELFKNGLLKKVKAETKTVAKPLRLTGEVQYDERRVAHVSTQVDGVIRKVHVTMGDKVTKGQSLIEIDSVEIGQTKAAYQESLAMESLARKNSERIEALRKEGILLSKSQRRLSLR